jgi:hypothetical protein
VRYLYPAVTAADGLYCGPSSEARENAYRSPFGYDRRDGTGSDQALKTPRGDSLLNKLPGISRKRRKRQASKRRRVRLREDGKAEQ